MSTNKTILILSANPKNTARLRLDEEVREIRDGLRLSRYRDLFLIQQAWAVRLRDLRRAMLEYEPQIVHFSGHGEVDGLMVEDEKGTALLVKPDALAGLFELFKAKVECVFLNACYSESQADAINKHIPYVIGMRQGITDKAALEFAVGFYDALGAGKSVEEAFKFGCNAIQLYDIPDLLTPILKQNVIIYPKKQQANVQLNVSTHNFSTHREDHSNPPSMFSVKNEFIRISAGDAILGAKEEIVCQVVQMYGISGGMLEQISNPKRYTVSLPEFFISQYAVSNDEYCEFVKATKWRKPSHWRENGKYVGGHPVVYVNFLDAEAFCQWKGTRLPTDDEWERAARGPEGRAYPWGDNWNILFGSYVCNTLERHQATREELVAVNTFSKYVSFEGLFNMAGNVWEWVDGGSKSGMKHTRGGAWKYQGDVYALSWFRLPTAPDIADDTVGFRYVQDIIKPPINPPIVEDLIQTVSIPGGFYHVGITDTQKVRFSGEFEYLRNNPQIFSRNESRSVQINPFHIRKYLVTNEEYYQFVKETGYAWPKYWVPQLLEWSDRPFLAKYRFHPVACVSYADAIAFCSWRGGRLPTNDEWEVAARGDPGYIYSWGDEFDAKRCNMAETGLARTNQINQYEASCSPFGCVDMVGNVQEWVAPDNNGRYALRGGSFQDQGTLYGLTFLYVLAGSDYMGPEVGFRCVFNN